MFMNKSMKYHFSSNYPNSIANMKRQKENVSSYRLKTLMVSLKKMKFITSISQTI